MADCVALVVAAGKGERFGDPRPKQYGMLAGQPLLRRALLPFLTHPRVDAVRAVIRDEDRGLYDEAVTGLPLLPAVVGGASRQESVRRGLESLEDLGPGTVLIHDAARPFVDETLISRVLAALDTSHGAVPALPVTETLKRSRSGTAFVDNTVARADLWRAQTPQGFRFADIAAAHRRSAGAALTDDAAVAEEAGLTVALVAGDEDNVKITTADDLRRAEQRLRAETDVRTGTGFDVHRFGPGDHVMLGGVAIAHHCGLAGHSDADVVLHALTDAVLGAVGAGDIGKHFPPGDSRWKGAASHLFLEHAVRLATARGGSILSLDVTVICERPKIGPHRHAMIGRIAAIVGLPPDRVSVKATTTEGLGFTGRREGIAAQAVATLAVRR
jgi:2-C-methyl-D-erythritol 4-phosphate cytidylyltransferase/2-C-methyl-D-erythritol 2,4-cyclodiphosphate synthase